jgi:hypothetical protein
MTCPFQGAGRLRLNLANSEKDASAWMPLATGLQ